jgi:CBS-domain-containing membrane protein
MSRDRSNPESRSSLKPIEGANRSLRSRLGLKDELALAAAPTITVLGVLALVEALSQQRLLFASLASSAFLIYLDPQHGTNTVRTLISAQMMAATIGLAIYIALGPGYLSGGIAMVTTIVLMIVLDIVHPPAVSTSLSFALRANSENNLVLFGLAVGITVVLVGLERFALWLLARSNSRSKSQ